MQTTWRDKNSRGTQSSILWDLPPGAWLDSHSKQGRQIAFGFWQGERSHFEILQSSLFLTRLALCWNSLGRASPAGVLSEPDSPGEGYPTPASSSFLCGKREIPNSSPLEPSCLTKRVKKKKKKGGTVKFIVQRHRLTERLRSNHKTIEWLPSPHTSPPYY